MEEGLEIGRETGGGGGWGEGRVIISPTSQYLCSLRMISQWIALTLTLKMINCIHDMI